jgi:hypothetical protein
MSTEMTVRLHPIATDGLPNMENLTGQVAFIFDGCIVSGWPLLRDDPEVADVYARHDYQGADTLWEADSDVGHNRPFGNVTHWVEFPEPLYTVA